MSYEANSIGRTLMGELFVTDESSVVHMEGTAEFDRCWKLFLAKKRDVIRSLSPLMTVDQKYAIIYPSVTSTYRSLEVKQHDINNFISIWCGCFTKAGMEV